MAAQLPVVVSDYDGYSESVREGVDGFRIRSWQAPAGSGGELMDAHADHMLDFSDYVCRTSAGIGLDIAQAAAAYVRLAQDPALRLRMGQNGLARARAEYDWARLIPRYQALFADLSRLRTASAAPPEWNATGHEWGLRHPRRSDPLHSFAHYPSGSLTGALRLWPGPLLPSGTAEQQKVLAQMLERPVYQGMRPSLPTAALQSLLQAVSHAPQGLGLPDADLAVAVGWLSKCGLIRIDTA